MLKRTLYFTQPAYLSVKDQQLLVKQEVTRRFLKSGIPGR